MNIGDKQIELINRAKKYLEKLKSSNINISMSSLCYFATWADTPGCARLKLWHNGTFFLFKYYYLILKNILAIASHAKYVEFGNQKKIDNPKILIVSWAFKNNFQPDGSYHDKYFNENSKNLPNSYWLLISTDSYVPTNLNNNLKVLKLEKGFFKYNFFYFFKILITSIFECKFSLKKILHYLSFHTYLAKRVSSVAKKELKRNNFDTVIMPYEGQPFQQMIFSEAKKLNEKILTIGYIHSMLTPFPGEHIYRPGSPDKLYVHGSSQIEILKLKLNWPENKLFLINPLRFQKDDKKSLSGQIFLPRTILDKKILLNAFRDLVINSPSASFTKLDIRNHPAMFNSRKHLSLKMEIEKIMKIYKNRFSNILLDSKISIFFGVTAAIFEALEKGNEVIQICSDPVFESLSEKIWPNLKIKKLNNFAFHYNLVTRGKYINFSSNNKISTLKNSILIKENL